MSTPPKLSFVVLSYNYADHIGQTIGSILAQTVQDFEIVVVDDASTDTSCDVVRSFADPRIRLLVNERNLGGAASYNCAVQAARGEYLVNLDADDWIAPNKCEAQLAFLAANRAAVVGTYVTFVDRNGAPAPKATELEAIVNRPSDNTLESWIGQNRLLRSSTMVERAAHLAVGLDDPSMVRAPDYELWTRFFRQGYRLAVIPEKLTFYRTHSGGVTHADPRGTFLEMSYAVLRNIVPVIEERGAWPSLCRIIQGWVGTSVFAHLRPVERYRLAGMLLSEPPSGDFSIFLRMLVDGADSDQNLVTAGRRFVAYATQTTTLDEKRDLESAIAAYIEARDFWHRNSQSWERCAKEALQELDLCGRNSQRWEAAAKEAATMRGMIRVLKRKAVQFFG